MSIEIHFERNGTRHSFVEVQRVESGYKVVPDLNSELRDQAQIFVETLQEKGCLPFQDSPIGPDNLNYGEAVIEAAKNVAHLYRYDVHIGRQ